MDYGHTFNFNIKLQTNYKERRNNMFKQQEENKLFQSEDALSLEWDFIENNNKEIVEEEKGKNIIVKMNKESKMIVLNKSTLTLEYSLSDLKRKIVQEFIISKDKSLKIHFDNKKITINNDLQLNFILEKMNATGNTMEIEVMLEVTKNCLLCMKSECYHTKNVQQQTTTINKRKIVENKTCTINFLEPEMNLNTKNTFHSTVTSSIKKRRIASPCTQKLETSKNLLIPFVSLN